jgi:hypothetical protein
LDRNHRSLPERVLKDAIIVDAGDFDRPFSLNILEVRGSHAAYSLIQRNFIANQLITLFKGIYGDNKEAFGPVFEQYFRAALFCFDGCSRAEATLADMDRLFGDRAFRNECCRDAKTNKQFASGEILQQAGGDLSLENVAPYITSKLAQFSQNPYIREVICKPKSTLDLPGALSEGRPVLVNLAKGLIGGPDAAILGGIIMIRLFLLQWRARVNLIPVGNWSASISTNFMCLALIIFLQMRWPSFASMA